MGYNEPPTKENTMKKFRRYPVFTTLTVIHKIQSKVVKTRTDA